MSAELLKSHIKSSITLSNFKSIRSESNQEKAKMYESAMGPTWTKEARQKQIERLRTFVDRVDGSQKDQILSKLQTLEGAQGSVNEINTLVNNLVDNLMSGSKVTRYLDEVDENVRKNDLLFGILLSYLGEMPMLGKFVTIPATGEKGFMMGRCGSLSTS